MAVSPEASLAFQREVDEELRREQLVNAWRRYGIAAAVAIVLALAVFGGVLWWQHHRQTVAADEGDTLQQAYEALGTGKADDAAQPLAALTKSNSDGYRALAALTQADVLLQKKDAAGAAAKFGAVAADTSLAQEFRDLALVRQTALELDSLKPDVVINRLKPLAVRDNPWFGSAGEMVAAAYLEQNRPDLAGALYGQIAQGPDVPETIRQRVVQMAGVLGVDAVAPVKDTPSQ